ncbi:MAG: carboxypeptidase-like regulatory domain-containing protein [Parcubacteria group bacterium]|jgi:hypothetical protein
MKLNQKIKNKNKYFKKGVSIVEALVLIFVFSIITISFYSVFSVGSKYIIGSKNKIIATSLANERMEMLRNLAYDSVATIGGIPNGPIDPDENITVGGKIFRVTTDVRFYDDPADGIFDGSPFDNVSNDYKIAEVVVSWGDGGESERATLSSRFVPPGVENSVGGGTFSINSIDYAGNPVPNVTVNIYNNQISPTVNYTTHTSSNGNLLLQGVPGDINQDYQITMSKSGYETAVTYSPATAGFIPYDAHSNIIEGAMNQKTMIIDLLSNLVIKSKNSFGEDLPDVSFDLTGGRRLDDGTTDPGIYAFDQTVDTGSDSEFSIGSASAGKYVLKNFSFSSGDYEFRKVSVGDDLNSSTINLVPGTSLSTNMIFMDKNIDSAYINVKDSNTGSVIVGASVELKNTTLSYDVTLVTDKYGYVYFPETIASPLQNGETYDISVTATGYTSGSDNVIVNKFTTKDITLVVE